MKRHVRSCAINIKPNKKLERVIEDNFKFNDQEKTHLALFAYSDNINQNFSPLPEIIWFVYCEKTGSGERAVRLCAYKDEIGCEPMTFYKKDGLDCITQVIHWIQKYYTDKLNLASWVIKYALKKYDANCPLQLDNILHQGDPESLFSGVDACKILEKIVKDED